MSNRARGEQRLAASERRDEHSIVLDDSTWAAGARLVQLRDAGAQIRAMAHVGLRDARE